MQTSPNQKLLEWVRKFRADLTPDGTITRVELHHSIEGSMGERLATFEMADRDDDEDPDDLAQEIWDEAEEDAATRPTGQIERYIVQAFRGDTREPDEQKAFTTRGTLITALTGGSTEPPTMAGQTMAEMRRTNDLHALVVRMCEATAGSAAVQLQREREENNKLRETSFKYEELRQQLLDRSLDREEARKDSEMSRQMNNMLLGTLVQLAPVILTRVLAMPPPPGAAMPLGAAPSPPASSPQPIPTSPAPASSPSAVPHEVVHRDRAVANLLGSVSQAQMQTLLSTFTEEQTRSFLGIYTSFRESPPGPAERDGSSTSSASSTPHPTGDRHVPN